MSVSLFVFLATIVLTIAVIFIFARKKIAETRHEFDEAHEEEEEYSYETRINLEEIDKKKQLEEFNRRQMLKKKQDEEGESDDDTDKRDKNSEGKKGYFQKYYRGTDREIAAWEKAQHVKGKKDVLLDTREEKEEEVKDIPEGPGLNEELADALKAAGVDVKVGGAAGTKSAMQKIHQETKENRLAGKISALDNLRSTASRVIKAETKDERQQEKEEKREHRKEVREKRKSDGNGGIAM